MRITWIGAAGLVIEHEGRALLIDPYISRPSKFDLLFRRMTPDEERIDRFVRGLSDVAGVLVGHTHMDHAMDVPSILGRLRCKAFGGRSLANLVGAAGLDRSRFEIVQPGLSLEIGPFRVAFMESRHGRALFGRVPFPGAIGDGFALPARAKDYRHGEVWAFLISAGGRSIFHQGSADLLESCLDGRSAEALFCCVPGWRRRPELLRLMVEKLKPSVAAPFHFDDFSGFKLDEPMPYERVPRLPGNDPEGMIAEFLKIDPGLRIRRPGIGIPWDIEA